MGSRGASRLRGNSPAKKDVYESAISARIVDDAEEFIVLSAGVDGRCWHGEDALRRLRWDRQASQSVPGVVFHERGDERDCMFATRCDGGSNTQTGHKG
ncbi:MAG: hypothetical protein ACLQUZ_00885 [Rhizomicrobium sp.]